MPIRVKCEQCKKTLSVKDHLAGKKIKCPLCQSVLAVPLASPTKEPPAAAKEGGAPPTKKPAPQPVAGGVKKPPLAAKQTVKSKSTVAKPETNGKPASNGAKSNGKPPEPAPPVELPPENVEDEALSALADEPPPPEETQEPQTIDFKCQWCDEDVKLPIELAGKQAQCPNPECKRIVKVPLPKTEGKKDWRKMDRQGPAAARINMPEELENAWGTENVTRAGQGALAQAGIGIPEQKPVGVFGWLRRGFIAVGIFAVVSAVGFGGYKIYTTNSEVIAAKDIKDLVDGKQAKITEPLLKAEAYHTITLFHLLGREQKVGKASKNFQAALSYIKIGDLPPPAKAPLLNEQFLAIELALTQIEFGAKENDDLILEKKRVEWKDVDLQATLRIIKTPALQVIALREVAARLIQKGKKELAIGLAGGLSGEDPTTGRHPLAYRQQIALLFADDKLDSLPKEPNLAQLKELEFGTGNLRVGFAEGHARKSNFESAFKLANFPGPEKDRMDAHLGITAVALQQKNKEKAAEAFKAALDLAKMPIADASPWHWLELVRLGARLDDPAAKEIADKLELPPFKARAQLEIFLALCEKSTTPVPVAALADIEANGTERTTLALAWIALARQHARTGASLADIRKTFKAQTSSMSAEDIEMLRPMVDIGAYQGFLK